MSFMIFFVRLANLLEDFNSSVDWYSYVDFKSPVEKKKMFLWIFWYNDYWFLFFPLQAILLINWDYVHSINGDKVINFLT